ncbi:hypothetical protein E4U51_005991 [Claviceps purpurea]|nr:hypothetical protein E4U51_005991 [Claviceps purpurea]
MWEKLWPSTDNITLNNALNATVGILSCHSHCMDSSSVLLIISLVMLLNPVTDVPKTTV